MPKVWGGRRLEKFGRTLPDGDENLIGESWELADLGDTDPSGAGGEAARSVVANGPLAGRTLHDLLESEDTRLRGSVPLTDSGAFPLLVKFLDARENLSVQVHPSPAYAAEHPDAHLKSEAWYVVDAEPDAIIYKGIRPGVTAEQFREAIHNDAVEPLLERVPARVGECHYLPSGTVHALGAGVMVAEVQTPSDTTFRVYDWGRTGRKLHVEQALASIRFERVPFEKYQPDTRIERNGPVRRTLVHCEHFRIERMDLTAGTRLPIVTNDQPRVWIVLGGSGRIACDGEVDSVAITRGRTILLPAALAEAALHADRDLTYLEVTFPQATGHLLA